MMKNNKLLIAMILLISIVGISAISCGADDDDDDSDPTCCDISELELETLKALNGTWKQTEITQNGNEPKFPIDTNPTLLIVSDLVNGTANTYTVTEGHYVLPTGTGSWSFVPQTSVLAMDLGDFTVVQFRSDSTLTLTRTADVDLGGRLAIVPTYKMTFIKK